MTCENVLQRNYIKNKKDVEIQYDNQKKKIKISFEKDRYIQDYKYLNIDVIIIEILENEIERDFFLLPNLDYTNGYSQFNNNNIFILQYPLYDSLTGSSGKIISNDSYLYEFFHNASTKEGSSGSPIFLINSQFILGIHKEENKNKNENKGIFIGPIVNTLKNNLQFEEKKLYDKEYYSGELNNGIRQGYGKYFYKNGDYYEGEWLNDKKNGKGIIYYKNGEFYIGEWLNDKRNGKGIH